MVNFFNLLKRNLYLFIGVYFLIQLIYIIFFPVQYVSDSYYYYKLAQDCLRYNSFYPAKVHLYENYIVAPLYINLLVIVLSIYNSIFSVGLLNIILNSLQLFLLYRISEILFNRDTAQTAIILYVFYLNTLGLIITNYTELLFGVLILASIYFYFKKKKYSYLLSGIFAAASIGVRPLGWALPTAYLLIYLFRLYRKIKSHGEILQIFLGTASFILVFGLFNVAHFGKFVYTSTTGPVNLLIGANNEANGSYKELVQEKNNPGFIPGSEKKTYIEKGEIWEDRALEWIKLNHLKWISLIPAKIGFMFLWDDFAISPLMNMQDWNLYHIAKNVKLNKSFAGIMPESGIFEKIVYLTLQSVHYIYYILLLLCILAGFFLMRKTKAFNGRNFVLLLFSIIGVLMTITAFGIPRYKYTFLIVLLPFASVFLDETILNIKRDRVKGNEKRNK